MSQDNVRKAHNLLVLSRVQKARTLLEVARQVLSQIDGNLSHMGGVTARRQVGIAQDEVFKALEAVQDEEDQLLGK